MLGLSVQSGAFIVRTLSGEHCLGMAKLPLVPREIDATTMNLMNSLKRTFDLNYVLNPGRLFP
jgi:D-lactate dehydrogenase